MKEVIELESETFNNAPKMKKIINTHTIQEGNKDIIFKEKDEEKTMVGDMINLKLNVIIITNLIILDGNV